MKKNILKFISVMLTFVIITLPLVSNLSAAESDTKPVVDENKVLEARFLNMLNHNYVYGEDFENLDSIVNNSIIAVLDQRDAENSDYISQYVVNSYLNDMFGFEIYDFSEVNEGFEFKEGFVYIIPRGFSKYEHKAVSLKLNDDLTYTFTTFVTVKSHDGSEETLVSETIFAKNDDSIFGFNIVFSKLIENVNSI